MAFRLQPALRDLADDLSAEAEIGDVQEKALFFGAAVRGVADPADVHAHGRGVGDDLEGALEPGRDIQAPDEVAARSGRDDAQRGLGIDDPAVLVEAVGDLVHRAVAADADDELGAVLDGLAGDVGGVLGFFRELELELADEVLQALADLGPALARPAPVRLGIDDDLGLKPHRWVQAGAAAGEPPAEAGGTALLPEQGYADDSAEGADDGQHDGREQQKEKEPAGDGKPRSVGRSRRDRGASTPSSRACRARRRTSPGLKDRKGIETTASTTAATMPVRAPTTAPSPAVRATACPWRGAWRPLRRRRRSRGSRCSFRRR